jgi:hypothetical protein
MVHRLNKADQLALIHRHFEVACGERPAEVEESSVPTATSVIVGRRGTPPNPGKPNCGNAGLPSRAERRAPWSARWVFMAVI